MVLGWQTEPLVGIALGGILFFGPRLVAVRIKLMEKAADIVYGPSALSEA